MNVGKCPGNPVNLSSRVAAKRFLDHLVTDKGFHILYHLYDSPEGKNNTVIDHFEIMSGSGEYDDLFFSLHHKTDTWIPPEGYLFDRKIELKQIYLPEYNHIYLNESEISVERKYIHQDEWPDDWKEIMRMYHELPPLERYLNCSSGEDGYVENFPFTLIDELFDNLDIEISPAMKDWIISGIKPRYDRFSYSGPG